MAYVCDFETNTGNIPETRVWAWACVDIDSPDTTFRYGNDIRTFMEWLKDIAKYKEKIYFHNLKFDGDFILNHILEQGWTQVKQAKQAKNKTFSAIISGSGVFYQMRLYFSKHRYVTVQDSYKIIPLKVAKVAQAFGLEEKKGKIDYRRFRPEGYELNEKEIDYISGDVTIVAKALKHFFDQGLDRMTIGSNALYDYKMIMGNYYKYLYPDISDCDAYIRKSYKGGFTYLKPEYAGKTLGEGIVLDVNSLYPSRMYYEDLPWGKAIRYTGLYEYDEDYPLYVQHLKCVFRIKPDHIPTIQLKHSFSFMPNEYVLSSGNEAIELWLTSVDLDLFLDHYDTADEEFIDGYKFKAVSGIFREYIDKWMTVKIEATKSGNAALRFISKTLLNSLYGKFGTSPEVQDQLITLGESGECVYTTVEEPDRKPIYIPVASFITAYARSYTIRAAQTVYDRFVYADTDSLHLIGTDIPEGLDVDDTRLGAWKHESSFIRARFLRQKCYIELERKRFRKTIAAEMNKLHSSKRFRQAVPYSCLFHPAYLKVTCSGLPEDCHYQVTENNFHIGATYTGKLKPKHIKGGTVFEESTFTISR